MATLVLSLVLPENVAENGGTLLEIVGNFDEHLGKEFRIFIGPNGDDTDTPALTGIPGRPSIFFPLNGEKIRCFTPLLARGTNSIHVARVDAVASDTLVDVLEVFPKDFKTSTYDHRKAWAPIMETGPRLIEEEPVVSEIEPVDLLQATLDAIGEDDNEIGGLHQTRLTALVTQVIQAPDTFVWAADGHVYTDREPTELAADDWIRLDEHGRPFRIVSIVYDGPGTRWDIELDLEGEDPPETNVTALTGTVTWDGTTTVVLTQWEQVSAGMWIRGDADKQWFLVISTSLAGTVIANPWAFTIPSGALASSSSVNPVTSLVSTSVGVETTLNWPEEGWVAIDGVLYGYASKTLDPPSFDELDYVDGGETVHGLTQTHSLGAIVTDLTKARSAIEQTRHSMLVAFANGEDLNAIGRNYGVLRYAFLESDDVFRRIVQALAYNPRGTMFGLELALDAMVGAGNYDLFEDLVNDPCTVFIKLLGDAALTDQSEGKTFLTGHEHLEPDTTTQVTITGDVVGRGTVHSVRLKDENHTSDFRQQKPSADTIEEIEGEPPVDVWDYFGVSEAVNVTLIAGEGVEIDHQATFLSYYAHDMRIDPESFAVMNTVMRVEATATLDTNIASIDQWAARFDDGYRRLGWGTNQIDASTYYIRLISGGAATGATPVVLQKGVYYAVEVRKYGTSHVELWIDGRLKDRLLYSAFVTVAAARILRFGILLSSAPTTVVGRFRQFGFHSQTAQDYWGYREDDARVYTAQPKQIQSPSSAFVAGDVGKRIDLSKATVANPQGGNANGSFEIEAYVNPQVVDVRGVTYEAGATVQTANPLRVTVDARSRQFQFPDDLGKELVFTNSAQGNNGTYVVDKLLDADTLVDLEDWATPLRQKTTICEIVEPTPGFEFVSETALDWRLDPDFLDETDIQGDLSDAAGESGGVITLRQALPNTLHVQVSYSEVLSALVLMDFSFQNVKVQELPSILWKYYPFYLSDPLGFIRAYLDDITAAGVIPEYSLE